MMRTLGQKRAEFALEKVIVALEKKNNEFKKEFKSLTAGVPSMILMNGFGQTLAFMAAKKNGTKGEKYSYVFQMMKEWLVHNKNLAEASNDRDFILSVSKMSQKKYLDAQKEALAFLEWVKRYAAMECEGGD